MGEKDNVSDAPLHLAATAGHEEVVKTLIENGPHLEDRNQKRQTPLFAAATDLILPRYRGHTQIRVCPMNSGGADNMAKVIADSLSAHFDTSYNCYYSVTHVAWNQFYESVGIISKHPVEQEGYGQLATGVFPRKVVWNYIDTPLGMVHFFNTHLSYKDNHNHIRVQQVQKIKDPWPNVDAASGCLLYHFGLTEFEYYTVLFGVSRALGMCSQLFVSLALGEAIERPKSVTTEWVKQAVKG